MSNAYDSKRNDDNGHSCIDITMVCTSNAHGLKSINDTAIHALVLLWCVRQMRMTQRGMMMTVIHALILLWCVRQMRMV